MWYDLEERERIGAGLGLVLNWSEIGLSWTRIGADPNGLVSCVVLHMEGARITGK